MPIKVNINNSSSSILTKLSNNSKEVVSLNREESIIKTKTNSNNSIPVNPKDESNEVKMRSGCDINSKKLELEIKDEARTREAADKKLEKQIQDIIVEGVSVDDTTITFNKDHELTIKPEVLDNIDNKQDEILSIKLNSTSGKLSTDVLNSLINSNSNNIVYNNVYYYLSSTNNQIRTYFAEGNQTELNEVNINLKNGYYEVVSRIIVPEVDNTTIVLNREGKISLNQLLNANYYVVESIAQRDSIPNSLKKRGTIVEVASTKIVYEWDGTNWIKNPINILSLGNGLKLSDTGELSVDTTDEAIHLNKQPITSNGVYNILGDIDRRLEQI